MHQSNHWSNDLCVVIVARWYMIIVAECFPKFDEEPKSQEYASKPGLRKMKSSGSSSVSIRRTLSGSLNGYPRISLLKQQLEQKITERMKVGWERYA